MSSSSADIDRAFEHVETWIFDLDNTLYPHHLNLWQQVNERIRDYIMKFLQVSREEAPERLIKGLARHPVPVMLLARLAVDHRWHGQGVGKALLKDAMQRTLQAADIAGIRAFAVHAKDEEARTFYLKFDFIPSPTDPMHLFVLLKDVRRIIAA